MIHIVEVTLRMAIRAKTKDIALEIASGQFHSYADDGSLSDMMVYEWDDPVHVREEEDRND